ncbi:PAS domain S-box protein [Flavobacterium foetidum]|uniref:PAS domain S-box protein n=1 Tax=Flavobacterium foetidum TaxID=2026681 RepID=UPI0010752F8A|nr:PAS domain S-box protein [Flavobacterium foetidum]KAF2510543.1 PAS domain S-box protein [Flavobacterium foetidum]
MESLDCTDYKYTFLKTGGDLGRLINDFNWHDTALGSIEFWTENFCSSLSILLGSSVPSFLVWGNEHSFFYNDSFRPFLKNSIVDADILGRPVNVVLQAEWKKVTAALEDMAVKHIAKYEDNITTSLVHNGIEKEVYLTLSCRAVFDKRGTAQGIFVTCIESSAALPTLVKSSSVRSHLNNVLTKANAGIAQANIEGLIIEVNERYCEMLGYSREEILKMNLGDLTHPDDLEQNTMLIQDCILNGNDFVMTKRYVCKNGKEIWVNNSVSLVVDSEDKKYITAIAIDITEQKEKEKKLITSENSFKSLVAKAPVGTALFRGREFYVDLANDVMLGYWKKSNEIIGQKITEVLSDITNNEFLERLQQVYSTGSAYKASGALIVNKKTGKRNYFDYSLTPLFDENNAVYAVLHMCSDVTISVKAQNQIAENHNQLASIFEQSPVGIATLTVTDDLVFQSANAFYCELVGRIKKEIIGKPLLEALPELKGQGFDGLLREVINTGKAFVAKEVEVELFRNGKLEFVYVDLTYQLHHNLEGLPNIVLVIATDVTNQVLSRRKVEESEAKIQSIIATAPAGIGLFVGRDLIIENPNQTFIDIVGKGPNIVGLPLREAMPELITEGQAYLKILDDIFETGVPFISPASLVKINQNGVLNDNYYNISYTPIYNNEGEIYAILDIAIDVTAQVKAQQEKEESEAHLELLRDTVPAMIFYLDKEMRYCSYNSVFMDWFSVGKQEAIGKTVREFIGEAAYAKTLPHLTIAYGGEQERYEMFAPSRMGVSRWLSIVYTPHKNAQGEVIGLIVHATDVTHSKQTEMALRESEAKLLTVIEAAPVSICLFVGDDLRIENPNHPFILNVNKGNNIRGKSIRDILADTHSEALIEDVEKVYRTGESFNADAIPGIHFKDNQPTYYNLSLTPLFDDSDQVYAVLYVSSDVTKEISSIKKIEQAEEALRAAVEVAEMGTWSTDIATGITSVSARHAEIFGYKTTIMHIDEARSVIKKSDYKRVTEAFAVAQNKNTGGKYEAEYKIINGITGQERIIHSVGQTYFNEEGEPLIISGTAKDITLQREMQLALENEVKLRTSELANVLDKLQETNRELEQSNYALKHSNEELAQYAYVASHDLQEPLRKIRFFADMLENGNSSLGAQEIIKKIGTSAERMRQLIGDLLAFSRLVQPEKIYQQVDLNSIIENIWIDFELMIKEKNASIKMDKLPTIQASSLQMNQLFYNLISNSLKFTNPRTSPEITISSSIVTPDFVSNFTKSPFQPFNFHHLVFKDNGIGFEKSFENQIFEIFKRLHPQNIYPGSGIGLALCRRIVMNHQGVLHAESEPDKGSSFHVFLPMMDN